jgi:hypothetical protein
VRDDTGSTRVGAEDEARRALLALDRRRFLGIIGGAGIAGTLAFGCGGVPDPWRAPGNLQLQVLGRRSYATFNAAAARLLGPTAERAILARVVDPAARADAWVAREPALGGPLGQALWALEWGIRPLMEKWRPFTGLGGDARDAVLDDLMRSGSDLKRDIFKGVRSLAILSFYSDPTGMRLASYPGPFGGPDGSGISDAMRY